MMPGGQARMGKNWPLETQIWVMIWVGGPENVGLWAESSAMWRQKKKKTQKKQGKEGKMKEKERRSLVFLHSFVFLTQV